MFRRLPVSAYLGEEALENQKVKLSTFIKKYRRSWLGSEPVEAGVDDMTFSGELVKKILPESTSTGIDLEVQQLDVDAVAEAGKVIKQLTAIIEGMRKIVSQFNYACMGDERNKKIERQLVSRLSEEAQQYCASIALTKRADYTIEQDNAIVSFAKSDLFIHAIEVLKIRYMDTAKSIKCVMDMTDKLLMEEERVGYYPPTPEGLHIIKETLLNDRVMRCK